jgi:hypothetical protein
LTGNLGVYQLFWWSKVKTLVPTSRRAMTRWVWHCTNWKCWVETQQTVLMWLEVSNFSSIQFQPQNFEKSFIQNGIGQSFHFFKGLQFQSPAESTTHLGLS